MSRRWDTGLMADCIHQIDICRECGGLEVLRLDWIGSATGGTITVTGGGTIDLTGADVYLGPASTPCDSSPKGQHR